MGITKNLDHVREVVVDGCECSIPFTDKYGQPSLYTFEAFPTATSYAEYLAQEKALHALLAEENACVHVRDIVVRTHKTICGNGRHVATAKQALMFPGIDPEFIEQALLGDV